MTATKSRPGPKIGTLPGSLPWRIAVAMAADPDREWTAADLCRWLGIPRRSRSLVPRALGSLRRGGLVVMVPDPNAPTYLWVGPIP